MKKNNNIHKQNNSQHSQIPDIEVIDLENDGENTADTSDSEDLEFEEEYTEDDEEPMGEKRKLPIIHIIFFMLLVLIVGIIIFRLKNWGVKVDLDEIFKDGPGTYEDTLDLLYPLLDEDYNIINHEDPATIVAFGNAPFADDRDSKDNLVNMMAEKTGATIYNCSIKDSYLASQHPFYSAEEAPMDAFCLYWLVTLATDGPIDWYYTSAKEALGDRYPEEADEVINTITSLDFNEVDVVVIMYDATDYLLGHQMYSDEESTDIQQFTGNLEAGVGLLQAIYPHIRIIVMSPTYAYAVDEDGNYISSDQYTYGQDVLSTYVIKEHESCFNRSVSFVDHLYGSINENNARDYLIDNLHLNLKGRELVAERFEYFLNYYTKGYGETD